MDRKNGVIPNKGVNNFLPQNKAGDLYIIGNGNHYQMIQDRLQSDDIIILFNSINDAIPLIPDILFIANSPGMILDNTVLNEPTKLQSLSLVVWRYGVFDILFSRYEKISLSKKIKYLLRFCKFQKINQLDMINQIVIPKKIHNKCLKLLDHQMPSTGFLAIMLYLTLYPDRDIYIHNFDFTGWKGHNWKGEYNYIRQLIRNGELKLIVN